MREYFENEEYNAWWMDGLMDLLVGADFATALRIVQWPKPFLTLAFAIGVVIPKKKSLYSCNIRSDPTIFTVFLYPK